MSVEIHKSRQYLIATVREDIKQEQLNQLWPCFEMAAKEQMKALILDMVGVGACEEHCLIELVKWAQKLRESSTYVFVVRLPHAMQAKIQRGGLSQILIYRNDIDDALRDIGIETESRHKLDSEFLKPILDAAIKMITEKSGLDCKPGRIFSKIAEDTYKPDVIVVMGIVSSTFNGSMAITFQMELFNILASQLTNVDSEKDAGNLLLESIHQLANKELQSKNHFIQQVIPLIIRGENLQIAEIIPSPILIIPYSTAKGSFQIYIGLN